MTSDWLNHLIIAPILLPLVASALLLLLDERRRMAKNAIALATLLAVLVISVALLLQTVRVGISGDSATRVYLIGDWTAPFGIVLVLFLLQIMGLNGAFLTGDLFNLFVFFEILLAASYGLLLHGSGAERIKAGLHYVAINVGASLLFLIGVALIYGVTGTLNMADLATIIPGVVGGDLALLQSGFAVLGIAFLLKAGMWPLGFWLPRTYAAAVPPAAAVFALLSKVGIYALLRVYLLLFGTEVGWAGNFGEEWLLFGGIATVAYGTLGVLAARTLSRVAGFCVIISSGTLLASIGAGEGTSLSPILFYMVSSTLGLSAFYLLLELVERREAEANIQAIVEPVFEDEYTGTIAEPDEEEVGIVIPATIALLGGAFAFCALLLAGLPPLSGFIAKFAIIHNLLNLGQDVSAAVWIFVFLLIGSGLAILIATTRAGIDLLWEPSDKPQPPLRIAEAVPVGALLAVCLGLMVFASPVMRYMERTSLSLQDRQGYINAVLGAQRDARDAAP